MATNIVIRKSDGRGILDICLQPDVIRILQELAMYQMTVDFMWNSLKIKFGKPRIFDDHGILQEF